MTSAKSKRDKYKKKLLSTARENININVDLLTAKYEVNIKINFTI